MTPRTVTTTALVNMIILKTLPSHRITVESVLTADVTMFLVLALDRALSFSKMGIHSPT